MMEASYVLAHVNEKKIKIPLGLYRPILDSYSLEKWNKLEVVFANALKEKLEEGEISESEVDGELKKWSGRQIGEMELNRRKIKVYEFMRDKLNTLNEEIRSALKEDKAKCIMLLKDFEALVLNPILLLKNPSIIETIFILSECQYSTPRVTTRRRTSKFTENVEEVKQQVHNVIRKLNNMFNVPDNKSFFEVFSKEKELFLKKIEKMSVEDVNDLLSSAM